MLGLLVDRIDFDMSLPAAIAVPRASQRDTPATVAEAAFLKSPEAAALAARGHAFTPMGEIGAATGSSCSGRGAMLAAAEPVRRGGGSALVATPRGA